MNKYSDQDKCRHRIKRNYPHGHRSSPVMFCKDCKKLVSRHEMQKAKQVNRPRERKVARRKK